MVIIIEMQEGKNSRLCKGVKTSAEECMANVRESFGREKTLSVETEKKNREDWATEIFSKGLLFRSNENRR